MVKLQIIEDHNRNKRFFYFTSELLSSTIQAPPIENIDRVKLIKGDYSIIHPITFKKKYGTKIKDILGTGCASLYLISQKMKNVLENNHLTGWKVFPIKLNDKQGNEINKYYGFSVIGHSGSISYDHSKIIEKKMYLMAPYANFYKGIFVDKWDGTDFFTPDLTTHILITKKAADILKENKISNIHLEHLSDVETSVRSVKKAGSP